MLLDTILIYPTDVLNFQSAVLQLMLMEIVLNARSDMNSIQRTTVLSQFQTQMIIVFNINSLIKLAHGSTNQSEVARRFVNNANLDTN